MTRLAVFVSGSGSNLDAILKYPLPVTTVVADRVCPALEIAGAAGVTNVVFERPRKLTHWSDRDEYTSDIVQWLLDNRIDLVAMAGFMTILSPHIFEGYKGRILNLHPSLLPKFKGAHAVRDALASGEKVTGCTVHIATAELDNGPILAQEQVPILDGDTVEILHERIKMAERELYPKTIAEYLKQIS